jgi:hypothetical protein
MERLDEGEIVTRRINGAHLRSTPRYKLFQPSEMSTEGATRRVHLLNLSAGGALIYASEPPPPGTTLRLYCAARFVAARVAWRDERRFGVAFITPLADTVVSEVIAAHDALVTDASRLASAA